MLQETELRRFVADGYLHLKHLVPPSIISTLRDGIQPHVSDLKERKKHSLDFCSESLPGGAQVLDLIRPVLAQFLGSKWAASSFAEGQKIQLALAPKGRPGDGHWHFDSLNQLATGFTLDQLPVYQLIVGVYLTNLSVRQTGNLVVWPGGHSAVAKKLMTDFETFRELLEARRSERAERVADDFFRNAPAFLPRKPETILAHSGDVVFFHTNLPHSVATNLGEDRPALYFRFGSYSRTGKYALAENIWLDWSSELVGLL